MSWIRWGRYRRTGAGPPGGVDAGEEQVGTGDRDVVFDADVSEVAAAAGGAYGLHERLLGADRFDDGVGAQAAGEFLDPGHARLAALFDDVGGAVVAGAGFPLGGGGDGGDGVCGAAVVRH